MAARWRLDPAETGLRAVGAGPRCSGLYAGTSDWILKVSPIGGDWKEPLIGWYWYGMGQNTCRRPCATVEDAKAEAMAFYRASQAANASAG